jgi:glycosyltransferase involved in cell wall biosynthesis
MRQIALCVCTYNRPEGLRALLAAIDNQQFRRISDEEIHLVLVDNSQAGTASAVCASYAQQGRFKATTVREPSKGLAIARNAALSAARSLQASHVAFVDDDELPDPSWLDALVGALEATDAAAAIGPVAPIFETQPSAMLPLSAFADRRVPKGSFVDDGYTCNAIIAVAAIDAAGKLQFDARFNQTGGEDTYFFKQLLDQGMKIAWAKEALVYAVIPRHRMSTAWILRRWYRTGMIEAHLGQHDPKSLRGRLLNFAKGTARIGGGSLRVAAAAFPNPWRERGAFVASFFTICRGAGLIANALGRDYEEYASSRYR